MFLLVALRRITTQNEEVLEILRRRDGQVPASTGDDGDDRGDLRLILEELKKMSKQQMDALKAGFEDLGLKVDAEVAEMVKVVEELKKKRPELENDPDVAELLGKVTTMAAKLDESTTAADTAIADAVPPATGDGSTPAA